jgi:phosphate transport system substrate-binding protein
MLHKKNTSIATLALLLALAVVPKPATASQKNQLILAQSPATTNSIPLPKSVKSGTVVRIDGSSSAATFNQALKQRFEKEYSNTKVNIGYRGTTAALNSLLKGQIDIAAIGRPLTNKEKSQGLVAVALPRTKIAVVVGPKNSFQRSITDAQFARIFRGEIRDWSTVGGKRGRIRLIDRPRNSDTRQTLQNYPVFRNRAFRSGPNAVRLSEDTTSAVIKQLGTDGIGYAISNQVTNRPDVRIVSMHKVLPNDPKYPFSQPIYYVYRSKNPSPAALAFLGFAKAPQGQQVVKAAALVPVASTAAKAVTQTSTNPNAAQRSIAPTSTNSNPGQRSIAPTSTNSNPGQRSIAQTSTNPPTGNTVNGGNNPATSTPPAGETQETQNRGGLAWLWWLIPLLALLGIPIWWLLKNRRTSTTAVGESTPPPLAGGTTSVAPTQTVVPPATNVAETIEISPSQPQETATTAEPPLWGEESLPTTDTQIQPVTPQEPAIPDWLGGAVLAGGAAVGAAATAGDWDSSIDLKVENSQQVLATWQLSEAHKQTIQQQGSTQLAIRLYDITDIDQIQNEGWQIFQQFEVEEQANQMLLPILVSDRDYNAEIGYLTEDELWLPLAKSHPINIPVLVPPVTEVVPPTGSGLIPTTSADWGSSITLTPQRSQIALPSDTQAIAKAAWQVSEAHKQAIQEQGGLQLAIRLYDFSDINQLEAEGWQIFQQFNVDPAEEQANQMSLPILVDDRYYIAEIGYLADERWFPLAQSHSVYIPVFVPSANDVTSSPPPALIPTTPADWGSSIIFTPQTVTIHESLLQALAAWQVSNRHKQALQQQGGRQLVIRLYDVTETSIDAQVPADFYQFAVDEQANQMLVTIPEANRNYAVEIGYLTDDNRWLLLARSAPVTIVPLVQPTEIDATTPTESVTPTLITNSINLTPLDPQQALATWQISETDKQALQTQGGTQLALRLYDVTGINQPAAENWEIFQQFNLDEPTNQMLVPILVSDRDYAAEIGYLTEDDRWLMLAKSAPIKINTDTSSSGEINLTPEETTPTPISSNISLEPETGEIYPAPEVTTPIPNSFTSSISLIPKTANQIIANWQVSEADKQALQQQGGRDLKVRFYDITKIDFTSQEPQAFQQLAVNEQAYAMLLEIAVAEPPEGKLRYRDYTAEIGYLTNDDRWLLLARSAPLRIIADTSTSREINVAPKVAAVVSTPITSSISLEPETANQIVANWQISEADKKALQAQGGTQLALRLYDVTEINQPATENWEIFQQFNLDEPTNQMLVPILVSDRDYAAEIGYLTEDDRWLLLARSAPLRIIADTSTSREINVPPKVAAVVLDTTPKNDDSTITLVVENSRQALATWQVSSDRKQTLREQGGRQLAIRLYDVTEIDLSQHNPQIFQQFPINEQVNQILLPIPLIDRDYLAEIGYLTNDDNWLMAARSAPLTILPEVLPATEINLGALGAVINEVSDVPSTINDTDTPYDTLRDRAERSAGSDSTQSEIEAAKFNLGSVEDFSPEALAAVDEGLADLPSGYDESRIVLMPRDPQWAYTYWDIPSRHKEELRQQGGSKLALRFYDVTDVDMDYQNPHSVQEFECEEMGREWYLPVPVSDRDYIVEIGYLTNDGRWLMLARSNSIHVPPLYPSSWSNDQFITIAWEEELEHKQILNLGIPNLEAPATPNNGSDDAFFGTLATATLAEQSISSYIFPSGIGKWASGVGFSPDAIPESSRQFWLMADAELVVYGATEPDALITIGGRPIKANSDGTFRFQLSFQDGMLDFPIEAFAPDGEQTRSIHLKFDRETPLRNTNTKEEAQEE